MKKLVLGLVFLAMIMVSCGPSAEQLEQKRVGDSISLANDTTVLPAVDSTTCCDSTKVVDCEKK